MLAFRLPRRDGPQVMAGVCRSCGYAHAADERCVNSKEAAEVLIAIATEFANVEDIMQFLTEGVIRMPETTK